ncbi:MAG TPA: hypothetical protein VFU47_13425 [Armatimonadota bacterium]|nr:hypothetical protein [Armatimonadota bacterium]
MTGLNTFQVRERLKARYQEPQYAYFDEVRDAAGFSAVRTLDGLAMGVWPSRGLTFLGFEIKVSRADWLRELKNPQKADGWWARVDRLYLVVGDAEIVKPGELPDGWGLIVPYRDGLKIAREPLQPAKLDWTHAQRHFLASILRRLAEVQPDVVAVSKARREGIEEGRKAEQERRGQALKTLQEEHDALTARVAAFEEAAGLNLSASYYDRLTSRFARPEDARRLGAALRRVLNGDVDRWDRGLDRMEQEAEGLLALIRARREELHPPDLREPTAGEIAAVNIRC